MSFLLQKFFLLYVLPIREQKDFCSELEIVHKTTNYL